MKQITTFLFALLSIGISYSQNGTLDATNGVTVGDNPTITTDGTIRYDGTDFLGLKSGTWQSLTSSSGGGTSPWSITGADIFYNNGDVGIGILNPSSTLHVEGNGPGDGITITRSGTSVVTTLHSDGGEGTIGTRSSHDFRFLTNNAVAGEIKANGNWAIGSTTASEKLDVNGAINIGTTTSNNAGTIRYVNGDFEGYNGSNWNSLTSGGGASVWSQNGNEIYYDVDNVGIGTTNPSSQFHVIGDNTTGETADITTTGDLTSASDLLNLSVGSGSNENAQILECNLGTTPVFQVNADGLTSVGNGNNRVVLDANDDSDNGTAVTETSSIRMYDDSNTETVTIFSDAVSHSGAFAALRNSNGVATIELDASTSNTTPANGGGEIVLRNDAAESMILLQAKEGSTQGAHMQLRNNNNEITIDLDADFNGDGRIITDEIQINGGSDFAENFDITDDHIKPIAGMLVVIDKKNIGKLEISKNPNDKKIAGVISGANGIKPGVYMGQKETIADGEYPIALSGRVYVYANQEGGIIEPGDMLTSSSQGGYAMKSSNNDSSHGTIIGKAMSGIDENGFVLVLVNLQ